MSKLNITLGVLTLLILVGISFSTETTTARESHEHEGPGKSQGPVQVKIKELAKSDSIVELEGIIRSKQENLESEWKLPEGATLVEGDLVKTVNKSADINQVSTTIKVDISNAKDEPIVFMAYFEQNDERIGHSRVYKWNKKTKDIERVEKVRAKMKARKAQYVH